MALRALARVNLAAIERNVARLRSGLAPGTGLCAVVKANGYGHGALPVARVALDAGARLLAVATAEEAAELRADGIEAPVLVMGAISEQELPVALGAGGELVAWTGRFVSDVERALSRSGSAPERPVRMHVKLDTGMGRLGTRERCRGGGSGRADRGGGSGARAGRGDDPLRERRRGPRVHRTTG